MSEPSLRISTKRIATKDLHLGIDVGTTKVAVVLTDTEGEVVAGFSEVHGADVPAAPGRAEQDPRLLLDTTWGLVSQFPVLLRRRVRGVGVTGQMHGVVLLDAQTRPVSPLITWQDQRCLEDEAFLAALSEASGYRLHTGYGLATLAWMRRHAGYPADAVAASTIQDLVVAHLCALPRPVTDPSDAASWGFFDLVSSSWDAGALAAAGVPPRILPDLRPFGAVAGPIAPAMAAELGMPPDIPVQVALGDLHASLLATIQDPDHDLALTLGTGGQAAVLTSDAAVAMPWEAPYACWPYPGGRYVVVAASLCGGAAWAWLADSLGAWLQDLGVDGPARDDLFDRLNVLGLAASDEITVRPHFLGERLDPMVQGSLHGLTLTNCSLGALARGLARSIVLNLRTMLPSAVLTNRRRVVGSGNALRRSPLLQRMTEDVFGLPLTIVEGQEDAATGAALVATGRV